MVEIIEPKSVMGNDVFVPIDFVYCEGVIVDIVLQGTAVVIFVAICTDIKTAFTKFFVLKSVLT